MAEPRAERPYMPDYGVDTPAWEPLPWSWAAERLIGDRGYLIVTASADGRPHALPVWGVWDDGDKRFMFSCGPRSRKARNVAANEQVAVARENTIEAVSVEGRAAVLADAERQAVWIERYLAKYQPIAPALSAEFLAANLIIEVTPERAFGIVDDEDKFSTSATRWTFAT